MKIPEIRDIGEKIKLKPINPKWNDISLPPKAYEISGCFKQNSRKNTVIPNCIIVNKSPEKICFFL